MDFLSHLPSFEFYGFQSLERGRLEIKTKYICVYIRTYVHVTGWGQTVGSAVVRKCVSTALLTRTWVSNPRPARLYYTARAHICTLCTEAAVSMAEQFRQLPVPLTVMLLRSAL